MQAEGEGKAERGEGLGRDGRHAIATWTRARKQQARDASSYMHVCYFVSLATVCIDCAPMGDTRVAASVAAMSVYRLCFPWW